MTQRDANFLLIIPFYFVNRTGNTLERDGVCNPVTHVLRAIEVFKRFGRGYKPRPASESGVAQVE